MIDFDNDLLIGAGVKKKIRRIMRRLTKEKALPGVWLVTNPTNEENLFDIFDAKLLIFSYYKRLNIHVYAVAKGQDEAEKLLLKMLEKKYGVSADS